jgi:hypothetical protein
MPEDEGMTWDSGFGDLFEMLDELEHQAHTLYALEREPEIADRGRAEYAGVTLSSRLMASLDAEVSLEVTGVGRVEGRLGRVAADWCLLRGAGQDWVVRSAAVTLARQVSDRSVPEVAWSPVTRLGFGSALRRIADAGRRCVLRLVDGSAHDVHLRRIGADFVEVEEGSGRLLVAHAAVAAVQSRED